MQNWNRKKLIFVAFSLLITDSVDEAKQHAAETFEPLKEAEKEAKEKWEEEEKKRLEEEVHILII
jgi:hypothetical protein